MPGRPCDAARRVRMSGHARALARGGVHLQLDGEGASGARRRPLAEHVHRLVLGAVLPPERGVHLCPRRREPLRDVGAPFDRRSRHATDGQAQRGGYSQYSNTLWRHVLAAIRRSVSVGGLCSIPMTVAHCASIAGIVCGGPMWGDDTGTPCPLQGFHVHIIGFHVFGKKRRRWEGAARPRAHVRSRMDRPSTTEQRAQKATRSPTGKRASACAQEAIGFRRCSTRLDDLARWQRCALGHLPREA